MADGDFDAAKFKFVKGDGRFYTHIAQNNHFQLHKEVKHFFISWNDNVKGEIMRLLIQSHVHWSGPSPPF